jgi:hypothetical protein
LGASFHGSFPSVRQTVWHPQTKTLKDAADAAIKSAIYMLNRRSCWDALHEIQRVVDISGDIGALITRPSHLHRIGRLVASNGSHSLSYPLVASRPTIPST